MFRMKFSKGLLALLGGGSLLVPLQALLPLQVLAQPVATETSRPDSRLDTHLAPAAEAKAVVRIAAEDNWPPFSDEKGKGLSQRLVSAAFARQGYQVETQVVPYARALYLTTQGKTDACWNVTRQHNTEQNFLLHQTPLFQAASSFYYLQSAQHYRTEADIPDGAVVGVIRGYEYGNLFEQHKPRFQLVEVSTHRQLIGLLQEGRLDLAIFFDDVLAYYLRQEKLAASGLVKGATNHVSDIFVAFHKEGARSAELARALDMGLQQLQQSGDYQRLLQMYRQPVAFSQTPATALQE